MNATLGGVDSLLATVQMPPGVPVASMGIGRSGAKNAAWMAARILSLGDDELDGRMQDAIAKMTANVLAADEELRSQK